MKPIPIGVILGGFAIVIFAAMTTVVVTFIVTNDKAIKMSIGTLVDNVMMRNLLLVLRLYTYLETTVYQTATAITIQNTSARFVVAANAALGDLNVSTAASWAAALEPMWASMSLTAFPSTAILASFELWSSDGTRVSDTANADTRWNGAGCVPVTGTCFGYSNEDNRTVSAPMNDNHTDFFTENATLKDGPPSFLHYTNDFIVSTFANVHQLASSQGEWSPLYIVPSYAVTNTYCQGKPVLKYMIFFVCFEYTRLGDGGFSCVHGVGSMVSTSFFGQGNFSSVPSTSAMSIKSLKTVDMMNGACNPDAEVADVLDKYTTTCDQEKAEGKMHNATHGDGHEISIDPSFSGGTVSIPTRSVFRYSYCTPRAYVGHQHVTSTCALTIQNGVQLAFVDQTARSFFFGAADRTKKLCLVLGCVVIALTFAVCAFFWLITTRPIRWICRGMYNAKTLATSENDTLDHAEWYTKIREVSMLYTAYLELRQALKELKAYVPQGLFIAPSDSGVMHPDALLTNLLALDGSVLQDPGTDADVHVDGDAEPDYLRLSSSDDEEDADANDDTPEGCAPRSPLFHNVLAQYDTGEQEMRETGGRAASFSRATNNSAAFSSVEYGDRPRRRSQNSHNMFSHIRTTVATTVTTAATAQDVKESPVPGIVTILRSNTSSPCIPQYLAACPHDAKVASATPDLGSLAGASGAVTAKGGLMTILPIQRASGTGSVLTRSPRKLGRDGQLPDGLASVTTGHRIQMARSSIDVADSHTVSVRFVDPPSPTDGQGKKSQGASGPSSRFDPSTMQLDLTRNAGVNKFRQVTCSFVFISFSFRFVDAENMEKDVTRLMDVIVRCTLRLGGVLEIFRPDLIAISFGAHATQSQHLQRAITCAASISKMSSRKMAARTRLLVDSGAYFVGSCGAHERISRVVFGDRVDFALDLLKHDLLLGRVLLTDRVAMCLPASVVTPVDYVIPLRHRTQGTQLFQLLDPKRVRDKEYRQGARQFRTAFMHALEGNFSGALVILEQGGLHDPELADYLARAMRYLMASKPVRPRYCRFQLTPFEMLGAIPRERVLKYQYDRLSLEQINPEQSAPSIQFGFGDGDSASNSVDPNGLSRAFFGDNSGGQDTNSCGDQQPPYLCRADEAVPGYTGLYGSTGQLDCLAKTHTADDSDSVFAMATSDSVPRMPPPSGSNTSFTAAAQSSRHHRQHADANAECGYADDDDDDPAVLAGLPPLLFKDHQGTAWHRMPQAIGSGAFADVYMVVSNTGSLMAAKCMRLSSSNINLEDVVAEVNIACGLFNDFIVNYTGWSHTAGYLFLLMEYMPGGTLQKLISGFPRGMPMQLARHYAADSLKGLAYLHRHNVIHADFKPQNVLLSVDGGCKISDFGSSLTRGRALQIVGDVFQLRGTPFYMSPEVASGAPPSMRSDIWSYGVCVYEILTGALPWKMRRLSQPESSTCTALATTIDVTAETHRASAGSPVPGTATPPPPPTTAITAVHPPRRLTPLDAAPTTAAASRTGAPEMGSSFSPIALPAVRTACADASGEHESRFSLNTSADSAVMTHNMARSDVSGEVPLVVVLPSVISASVTHVPGVLGGADAPLQPGDSPVRDPSNCPSAITLAAGAAGAEADCVASETWVDLPAMSDARFVQGIITGEIAPRVSVDDLPSKEAYQLVVACLRTNFKERPTAVELINHPFFFT